MQHESRYAGMTTNEPRDPLPESRPILGEHNRLLTTSIRSAFVYYQAPAREVAAEP
jgi:hypothetical protein